MLIELIPMPDTDLPRCDFEDKKLILHHQMTLPGDVEAITPAIDAVMEMARQMGCAAGKEVEVEIALREALANAIRYGCKEDRNKQVEFCVACDVDRGMLIVIRDPGPGFDPASIPSPIEGQNIYSTHGRGIYLINQLMDEVRYERGGTQIFMRKSA
jgi:serine/threonine-protein kinase RsbW